MSLIFDERPTDEELDNLIKIIGNYNTSQTIISELSFDHLSYYEIIMQNFNNRLKTNYFINYLSKFETCEDEPITLMLLMNKIKKFEPMAITLAEILISYKKFRD